jgi:hypothetical protein
MAIIYTLKILLNKTKMMSMKGMIKVRRKIVTNNHISEVGGLERGPLSLVRTTEELLE